MALRASTTTLRAWNRFIPYGGVEDHPADYKRGECTHLEPTGIIVQCPIVIKDVDEFQVMSNPNIIVVRIVSWRYLNGPCSEFHVYRDGVRHNRDLAVRDEGMDGDFSVQMLGQGTDDENAEIARQRVTNLVTGVIWMHSNSRVTKHCLRTRGRNDNLLI